MNLHNRFISASVTAEGKIKNYNRQISAQTEEVTRIRAKLFTRHQVYGGAVYFESG